MKICNFPGLSPVFAFALNETCIDISQAKNLNLLISHLFDKINLSYLPHTEFLQIYLIVMIIGVNLTIKIHPHNVRGTQ